MPNEFRYLSKETLQDTARYLRFMSDEQKSKVLEALLSQDEQVQGKAQDEAKVA